MKKIGICIACVVLVFALTGCTAEKNVMTVPQLIEPVGDVSDSALVKRQDICNVKLFAGQVVPYTEEIGFNTPGIIENIYVNLGDTVKKGDILATLIGAEDNARYNEIINNISQSEKNNEESNLTAEYDIKILKAEYRQISEQLKKAAGDDKRKLKNELEIKAADIEIAKQKLSDNKEIQRIELKELKRQKKLIEKEIKDYFLYAEMDGVVTCVAHGMGDQVSSDTFVVALSDMSVKQIKAEFISSSDIEKADRCYVRYKNKDYNVTQLPYDADEVNDLISNEEKAYAYYNLETQDTEFEVGEYIDMYVESGFQSNALVIPANALYKEASLYYVYKRNGDTKVMTEVTVGTITPSFVQITDGLAEGDEVYVKQ